MGRWARVVRGMLVVEAGGRRLVELEGGVGLGVGGVEGGRLVEQEVTLWRVARGREGRGSVGEMQMQEDGGYAELGITAIMPSPGLCRVA